MVNDARPSAPHHRRRGIVKVMLFFRFAVSSK
jgi:hypothetical protein